MVVKVVTDSTSDIPVELARSLDITVVPCNVRFGAEEYKDGVDMHADEFYRRLVEGDILPTTSQPSPGEFVKVYDDLGRDADGIVSIHISSRLSGTYNSALQGKAMSSATCPIEVVDSMQACMATGLVAIEAEKEARRGADASTVAKVARDAAKRSQVFFLVDTLEYLQRGGRIGKVRALFGTVLNVKPMCIVREGEVQELGRARTYAKGVARLQEVTAGFAPIDSVCVIYTTTSGKAHDMAGSISLLLPEGKEPLVARAGPTIGTYVGPGTLGVALLTAEGAQAS